MKILIRGAGFENKGAEAMLRVVQRELSKRIQAATFYAAVNPLEAPIAYRSGLIPLSYAPGVFRKFLKKIPMASKIHEFRLAIKNPDFARAIRNSVVVAHEINAIGSVDAVVDVSGFAYSDSCSWGARAVRETWAWVEYCQSKSKPYVLLPQAWGPFEKPEISTLSKRICATAALVVSRDDESSKYLAKLQGGAVSEVPQVPDIAFCFQGAPRASGRSILEYYGLESGRPVIAFVPNMRVYERTVGAGAANNYIRLLIEIANYCIENLDATVLLVPNEIVVPGEEGLDDRFLCGIVEAYITKKEHCVTIRDYHSSEMVKSLLGQIDFLIASRFHSLVFALSQGVPVIALGWSHKYHELLRSFGQEDFVVDHDHLDKEGVTSLIEKAWQKRESSSIRILETVPKLQKQIFELFDEVAELLCRAN